jgi:hypothetical protein
VNPFLESWVRKQVGHVVRDFLLLEGQEPGVLVVSDASAGFSMLLLVLAKSEHLFSWEDRQSARRHDVLVLDAWWR